MFDSYGAYIDDDAFDPYMDTPGQLGDDIEMGGGGTGAGQEDPQQAQSNGQQQELPVEQKLQLAERANEIYRQQLRYMQDHLQSLRSLIHDKESIIENLMLRYDLGILQQDPTRSGQSYAADEIDPEELRRKAEGLAQRTILENFELRELVNELRDENFHLRNEIYELQDKINRQALHISKLTKENEAPPTGVTPGGGGVGGFQALGGHVTAGGPDDDRGMDLLREYGGIIDDDSQAVGGGGGSGVAMANGVHPSQTDEAIAVREARQAKHQKRQSSMAMPKDFWGGGDDPDDVDSGDDEPYMTDEARAKRAARQNHQRKESVPVPNIFGDPEDSDAEEHPAMHTDEAKAKREQRRAKANKARESIDTPDIFGGGGGGGVHPSQTAEAIAKRAARQHKKNKSSVQLPYGFFDDDTDTDQDVESRQKKRAHARKESLMKQAGSKGHMSDEDIEVSKKADLESRRAGRDKKSKGGHRKRGSVVGVPKGSQAQAAHKRDPTEPNVDLGFDDPDVLLAFEKGRVAELTAELEETKKELQKQLNKPQDDGRVNDLEMRLQAMEQRMQETRSSKVRTVEICNVELARLTRVINALLQIEKCREITKILLDESMKI